MPSKKKTNKVPENAIESEWIAYDPKKNPGIVSGRRSLPFTRDDRNLVFIPVFILGVIENNPGQVLFAYQGDILAADQEQFQVKSVPGLLKTDSDSSVLLG